MRACRVSILLSGLVFSACGGGGGDGSSTAPPPPPPSGNQPTLGSVVPGVSGLNLTAGQVASIEVTALDTQNQVIPSGTTVQFTSGNTTVAEVESSGRVIALGAGSTQITVSVTFNNVTRTAPVAVTVTGFLPSQATVIASSGDFLFTPPLLAVAAGGTVTWTFGSLEHTVTFSLGGAPANINNGYATSEQRSFASAGSYPYVCTIHFGMSGRIIVR